MALPIIISQHLTFIPFHYHSYLFIIIIQSVRISLKFMCFLSFFFKIIFFYPCLTLIPLSHLPPHTAAIPSLIYDQFCHLATPSHPLPRLSSRSVIYPSPILIRLPSFRTSVIPCFRNAGAPQHSGFPFLLVLWVYPSFLSFFPLFPFPSPFPFALFSKKKIE